MTPPLATPLVLRSDFTNEIATTLNATTSAAILDKIIEESDRLQRWARRRFDERVETRKYTARGIGNGGDLHSNIELWLDDDLKAVTEFRYLVDPYVVGSGTIIPSTGYLLDSAGSRHGVTVYDTIRLNPYGLTVFYAYRDPVNSITVAGTWGYGGQWKKTSATVTSGLDTDSGAASFVSSVALEAGMTLLIGTEQLYVNAVSGTPATTNAIDRGINGTTAATHANGSAIYRWEVAPIIKRHLKRLVLVSIAQEKSPILQSIIVAEAQVAVASDGSPRDVLKDIENAGLRRSTRIMGV